MLFRSRRENARAAASAWLLVLSDCTEEELRAAALEHVKTSDFWPTPAAIRRQIQRVGQETKQVEADDGSRYWQRAIAYVGSYGVQRDVSPEPNAARAARAAQAMAREYQLSEQQTAALRAALADYWSDIGRSSPEDHRFMRANFCKAYRAALSAESKPQITEKVVDFVKVLADAKARK